MSADRCTTRILIVDDAEIMHEIFCNVLMPLIDDGNDSKDRFVLSHAHDATEAIQLVTAANALSEGFAVAFIDFRLGNGPDGSEVIRQIWQQDPFVQIVLCSAYDDYCWNAANADLPFRDRWLFVKKPLHPDEILQLALSLSCRWAHTLKTNEQVWRMQREVDQRLQVEANLRSMAEHDALTKLPNRSVLIERLQELVRAREAGRESIDAVLFMDLDNFKLINDSLGHNAGDELLNQVACRLRTCVRSGKSDRRGRGETIRLGGDEFVVLLENLHNQSDAVAVARRIVQRISEPFSIGNRPVSVGASVGVAYIDDDVKSPSEALKNADTAMYRAKLGGKARVAVFDSGMNQDINARLEMESALRESLEQEQLNILYQPIVDLRTGQITSAEALLRWTMSDGRVIPPGRFIPLAEDIGLITEIGYWTVNRAIDQILEIDQAILGHDIRSLNLTINISHIQLAEPKFEERLTQIVDSKRFPHHRLKLEINEAIAMRKPKETAACLKRLHDAGFGVFMDDFGTGHSSLACFHQFNVDSVKIDRAFVGSIAYNESHQAIVEAVIQLAHSLRASVIAEGLETTEQIRQLRALGCDLGQGFYFSSPISQTQLLKMMVETDPEKRLRNMLSDDLLLKPATTPELPGLHVSLPTHVQHN